MGALSATLMYFYPFKDPELDKLFADGLLKAGIKGEPSGYYKIKEENRLTGDEIRQLLFGWLRSDQAKDLKFCGNSRKSAPKLGLEARFQPQNRPSKGKGVR